MLCCHSALVAMTEMLIMFHDPQEGVKKMHIIYPKIIGITCKTNRQRLVPAAGEKSHLRVYTRDMFLQHFSWSLLTRYFYTRQLVYQTQSV